MKAFKIHELRSLIYDVHFLSKKMQELCLKHGELVEVKKKTVLFRQGEKANYFYIVLDGSLKIYKNLSLESPQDIEPTIVGFAGPHELIAASLMLDPHEKYYSNTVQSIGFTKLLRLSSLFFEDHWKNDAHLFQYTLSQINLSIENLQKDRCLQWLPLEKKVAYLLTEKRSSLIGSKITRKDIAEYIGTTQESVIRVLSKWTKEGTLQADTQDIIINDFEKLSSLWRT